MSAEHAPETATDDLNILVEGFGAAARRFIAERDTLRQRNSQLRELLRDALAVINGAPATIGLHHQIVTALKDAP